MKTNKRDDVAKPSAAATTLKGEGYRGTEKENTPPRGSSTHHLAIPILEPSKPTDKSDPAKWQLKHRAALSSEPQPKSDSVLQVVNPPEPQPQPTPPGPHPVAGSWYSNFLLFGAFNTPTLPPRLHLESPPTPTRLSFDIEEEDTTATKLPALPCLTPEPKTRRRRRNPPPMKPKRRRTLGRMSYLRDGNVHSAEEVDILTLFSP